MLSKAIFFSGKRGMNPVQMITISLRKEVDPDGIQTHNLCTTRNAVSDLGLKKYGGNFVTNTQINISDILFFFYVKNSPIILGNVGDSWKKWGKKPIPHSRSDSGNAF